MSNRLLHRPRFSVGNRAPIWPYRINPESPHARGLVGCWPLGKQTRGKGLRGGDLTITNATFRPNRLDTVNLHCDGIGDHAQSNRQFNDDDRLGISCWFRFSTGHGNAKFDRFFEIGGFLRAAGGLNFEQGDFDNEIRMQVWSETESRTNTWTFTLDEWHHLFVFSKASNAHTELWIDGASTVVRSFFTRGILADRFTIGARNDNPANNLGACDVLDFRIYQGVELGAAFAMSLYDPLTRWDLYRESRVARAFANRPAAGTAVEADLTLGLGHGLTDQALASASAGLALASRGGIGSAGKGAFGLSALLTSASVLDAQAAAVSVPSAAFDQNAAATPTGTADTQTTVPFAPLLEIGALGDVFARAAPTPVRRTFDVGSEGRVKRIPLAEGFSRVPPDRKN